MNVLDALTGKRLLVLEDEPIIAIDFSLEAVELGASVERVMTVPRALAALKRGVDGAVLDYTLPARGNADAVALELKRLGVPFVFYSGDLDQHGERIAMHGAPMIAKPAPVRKVMRVLAQLMGER